MLIENHKIRLRESLELITWAITHGAVHYQRTIGFHSSAAAVDLLNIYLHQENLLDTSSDINHRRLRSQRMLKEALPFDFPNKTRTIEILCAIEAARDNLCYGRPQPEPQVEATLAAFAQLRALFGRMGAHEG